MNRLLWKGIMVLGLLIPAVSISAQSTSVSEQLYGQGVHAYFAGQYLEASDLLSQAIENGTRDPRIFYFRGLAMDSIGDNQAALDDFAVGAQLEFSATGRFYAVGRALERVQGPMRMEIEHARRAARQTLRKLNAAPQTNMVDGVPVTPLVPDPLERNPAATQANFPDVTGVVNPGTPLSDPIVTSPVQPVMRAPNPASDSSPKAADPFGEKTPSTVDPNNPFGGNKSETPPGEDPFATDPPPPSDDDPFATNKGTGNKAENEDPFAEKSDTSKKPQDNEDPFADPPPKKNDDGKKKDPPKDPPGGNG